MDWLFVIDWKSVEGVIALGLIANVFWSGLKWGGTKLITWTQDYWTSLSEEREQRREQLRARLKGDGLEQLHVRIRAGYSLMIFLGSVIIGGLCISVGLLLNQADGAVGTLVWLAYVLAAAYFVLAFRNGWRFIERTGAVEAVRGRPSRDSGDPE